MKGCTMTHVCDHIDRNLLCGCVECLLCTALMVAVCDEHMGMQQDDDTDHMDEEDYCPKHYMYYPVWAFCPPCEDESMEREAIRSVANFPAPPLPTEWDEAPY